MQAPRILLAVLNSQHAPSWTGTLRCLSRLLTLPLQASSHPSNRIHSRAGSSRPAPLALCTPCRVTRRSRLPPTCRWGSSRQRACHLSHDKCIQLVLHLKHCTSYMWFTWHCQSVGSCRCGHRPLQRSLPCLSMATKQKVETLRSCLSRGADLMSPCGLQKEAGISSAHYHAGMSAGARVKVQNAWRSGAVQVRSAACCRQKAAAPCDAHRQPLRGLHVLRWLVIL